MDESAETILWQCVTFVALIGLVLTLAVSAATLARRTHGHSAEVKRVARKTSKEAWVLDPELGSHGVESSGKAEARKHDDAIIDSLRGLLQDEVPRQLEHRKVEHPNMSCGDGQQAAGPVFTSGLLPGSNGLSNGVTGGSAEAASAAGSHTHSLPDWPNDFPPPPVDAIQPSTVDAGTMTDDEQVPRKMSRKLSGVNGLAHHSRGGRHVAKSSNLSYFGETALEPLRSTLKSMTQDLHAKDAQTQKLTKQLRQCQQSLWRQTLEERGAKKRLKDLLCDPNFVPKSSLSAAKEIKELQREIEELSSRLADARGAEMQWSLIAKRQRAFFAQNEKSQQEGLTLFKKHPAGELFLALPQSASEGEEEGHHRHPRPNRHRHSQGTLSDEDVDDSGLSGEDFSHDGDLSPSESEDEHARSRLHVRLPLAHQQPVDPVDGDDSRGDDGLEGAAPTTRSL